MKYSLILIFLFCCSIVYTQPAAHMQKEKKANIIFECKTLDLGVVDSANGDVVVDFIFSNMGEIPLIIYDVKPSCGCIVPNWSKKPVEPGKKGKLKVKLNMGKAKGRIVKTIFIESNAEQDVILLKLKAEIH